MDVKCPPFSATLSGRRFNLIDKSPVQGVALSSQGNSSFPDTKKEGITMKMILMILIFCLMLVPAVYAQDDTDMEETAAVVEATTEAPAEVPATEAVEPPAVTETEPAVAAAETKPAAPAEVATSFTGVIEIVPKKDQEKYDTVLLKGESETWKLLPAKKFMDAFKTIEKSNGKSVKVEGELKPATEKYPMAAIQVTSVTVE